MERSVGAGQRRAGISSDVIYRSFTRRARDLKGSRAFCWQLSARFARPMHAMPENRKQMHSLSLALSGARTRGNRSAGKSGELCTGGKGRATGERAGWCIDVLVTAQK